MVFLMILLFEAQKCLYPDFSITIPPVGFPEEGAEHLRLRRKGIRLLSQALVSMEEGWSGTRDLDLRTKVDLFHLTFLTPPKTEAKLI